MVQLWNALLIGLVAAGPAASLAQSVDEDVAQRDLDDPELVERSKLSKISTPIARTPGIADALTNLPSGSQARRRKVSILPPTGPFARFPSKKKRKRATVPQRKLRFGIQKFFPPPKVTHIDKRGLLDDEQADILQRAIEDILERREWLADELEERDLFEDDLLERDDEDLDDLL